MKREKCECCGRYGARKHVEDKGPNGHGGRRTDTRYLCDLCEANYQKLVVARAAGNAGPITRTEAT